MKARKQWSGLILQQTIIGIRNEGGDKQMILSFAEHTDSITEIG